MTKQDQSFLPDLSHLKKLTSKIGILQHCTGSIPNPSFGYSVDDNARALIVICQYFETFHDNSVLPLAKIYFDYIKKAKIAHGYFHNFADSQGNFTDKIGSETSSARVIWALGYVVDRQAILPKIAKEAKVILADLPPINTLEFLRSKAYALIGYYYLGDKKKVSFLADSLVDSYMVNSRYNWFESSLTYGNAIMSFSLLLAHQLTRNKLYKEVGLKSLLFLDSMTRKGAIPSPVSHLGWMIDSKERPIFDQQVIDVADMILAALAYKDEDNKVFSIMGQGWFNWFEGNNINHRFMIDKKNGGCFDGLTRDGLNSNQGAESIVCYLLAYLAMVNPKLLITAHD